MSTITYWAFLFFCILRRHRVHRMEDYADGLNLSEVYGCECGKKTERYHIAP